MRERLRRLHEFLFGQTHPGHAVWEDPERTGYFLMAGGPGGSMTDHERSVQRPATLLPEDFQPFYDLLAQAEQRED